MVELGSLDVPFPWTAIWVVVALLPLTAATTIASALIERSGPIRLHHWAEDAGPILRGLYEVPQRFEAFRFLLSWLAKLLPVGTAVAIWAALSAFGNLLAWTVSLGLVTLALAAVEWLDRILVEHHAEPTLHRLTRPLRLTAVLLMPAIWLLAHWAPYADQNGGFDESEDEVSDNELTAFIDVGRREGILEPEEEVLVRSIVDFGDTQVKRVMRPRIEIVAAPVDVPLEELAMRFFESKHARLPLFRDSIDHVVGILHIRDLFAAMHGGSVTTADTLDKDFVGVAVDAESLVKPPLFVPETKSLRDLLAELQKLHQQMAIVVDEYVGVAGLVTVEDLVEEIVGDIADEHEVEVRGVEALSDGAWRVAGRTELWELAERTGVRLDALPYETVSGLICGELGHVPAVGERFRWPPLDFRIDTSDGRRVTTATVRHVGDETVAPLGETDVSQAS